MEKGTKAVLAVIVVALVIFGAILWIILPEYGEFEVDGIQYRTVDDEAFVAGYDDRDNDLIIPSEVEYGGETYTVVAISDEALANLNFLTVTIPDTVRYIGECAFMDSMVSSIHIPDSVSVIGDGAFASTYIKSITVSEGNGDFRTIDGILFDHDAKRLIAYPSGLGTETYSIPSGTETVDEYAFHDNHTLSDIHIPSSVMSMDSSFLNLKAISGYHVDPDNRRYSSVDGVLFTEDGKTLISYPLKKEGTAYDIPVGTETLGTESMARTQLEYVGLPETVKTIGDSCFSYSYYLREIGWNGSVDHIGEEAFNWCIALESMTIPDNVETIGEGTFTECDHLRTLDIGSGLRELDAAWFEGCTSLETITVSSSNVNLVCVDGIVYTRDMETLCMAPRALEDTTVTVHDGVGSIGNHAFQGSMVEHVILPDSIGNIGEYAFYDSALRDVDLGNGVETIGTKAFMCCYDLESVTIPSSVNTVGESAFYGCNSLTRISFQEGVEEIGDHALSNCSSLVRFNIPSTLKSIGTMIYMTSLENVSVSPESDRFTSVDGIVYTKDLRTLVLCPARSGIMDVRVMEGTETIAAYAFSHCKDIVTVTLPSTVRDLEEGTFYRCSSLTSVNLENIRTLGDDVFNGCSSMKEAVFGKDLHSIGDRAFLGCTALTSMTFGCDTVPEIGDDAFILGDSRMIVKCTVRSDLGPGFLDGTSRFVEFDYVEL